MRRFLLILFAILAYSAKTKAQTTTAVYPFAFIVDNQDLVGSTIPINSESFSIIGTISFNVHPSAFTSFNYMETKFEIVDGSTVLHSENGPTFSRGSDFYNDNNLSNAKYYSLNIPKEVTNNIGSNHPNAKLIVRYRYKILGNGSWLPSNGYYRGDSSNEYSFKDARPRATIIGPDEIEQEGIYQVTDATQFKLVVDDGTSPIATLTDLGNGNYKLTRTGNRSGPAYLVATHQNGLETVKTINIIASAPVITGPSDICTDGIYTVQYASSVTLENATGIATLTNLGNGQWKVTKTADAGEVTLKAYDPFLTVTKTIKVGAIPPTLVGPTEIVTMGSYNYSINRSFPGSTLSFTVMSGDYPVTKTSDDKFTLDVTKENNSGMTFTIRVRINETGPCGISSRTVNIGHLSTY